MYEFSIPTFGKGVVYDIDHKIRAEHFRFFGEALKTSKLKEYVPQFVKETEVGSKAQPPSTILLCALLEFAAEEALSICTFSQKY